MDKRSANFTSVEVDFLVSAVKKWRDVIESKKSDHTSTEEKLKAGKDIEREFNSKYSHTFRSHKVLKTKYGNLKSTSKKNFAADKRAKYGTGGGSAAPKTATKMDHDILEICQHSQILGNSSHFDGDADDDCDFAVEMLEDDFGVNADNSVDNEEANDDKAEEVPLEENIACEKSWSKYTPKMLKRPMVKPLKGNKETTKNKWAKVAEAKLEKNNLEMELMKEKFDLEKQKLKLEIELLQIQIKNGKKE